jgi:branched-chain amino acid transport system permease protein
VIARGLAGILVAAVAFAVLPFAREALGFPVVYLVFLTGAWFWVTQATSWNILSGYSGYFSFGQAALVGVGAYATAVLVGRHGWDYFATLPIAGGLAMLLALLIGGVAFRLRSLRGEVFALLTLAVPFILASTARIVPAIDGGQGVVVKVPDVPDAIGGFPELLYLVGLAIATLAVVIAFLLRRTRTGWALSAIHDAEDVAEGLGVPTFRTKMLAIGLSGLLGGLGGSVLALQIGFVTVESVFGLTIPLFVIVMSVLGGRQEWLGPAVGAFVVVTLQDRLAASGFEGWSLVILGGVLALLVVLAPEGLLARFRQRPILVAGAFLLPFVGLAIVGAGEGLIDWLSAAMLAAAVAAFVPDPRRWRGARPAAAPAEVHGPESRPTGAPQGAPATTVTPGTPASAAAAAAPAAPPPESAPVVVACVDLAKH